VLLLSIVSSRAYSSTLPQDNERGAEQTLLGLPFDVASSPFTIIAKKLAHLHLMQFLLDFHHYQTSSQPLIAMHCHLLTAIILALTATLATPSILAPAASPSLRRMEGDHFQDTCRHCDHEDEACKWRSLR